MGYILSELYVLRQKVNLQFLMLNKVFKHFFDLLFEHVILLNNVFLGNNFLLLSLVILLHFTVLLLRLFFQLSDFLCTAFSEITDFIFGLAFDELGF
jgi:hypothetical protein